MSVPKIVAKYFIGSEGPVVACNGKHHFVLTIKEEQILDYTLTIVQIGAAKGPAFPNGISQNFPCDCAAQAEIANKKHTQMLTLDPRIYNAAICVCRGIEHAIYSVPASLLEKAEIKLEDILMFPIVKTSTCKCEPPIPPTTPSSVDLKMLELFCEAFPDFK